MDKFGGKFDPFSQNHCYFEAIDATYCCHFQILVEFLVEMRVELYDPSQFLGF